MRLGGQSLPGALYGFHRVQAKRRRPGIAPPLQGEARSGRVPMQNASAFCMGPGGGSGRGWAMLLMNRNSGFSIDCCPHPTLSQRDKHYSRSERGIGVRAGINKLRIRRGQQKRKTGISVHKPYCPPAVDAKPALTARKTSAATPRAPAALPWRRQSCRRGQSKNWSACR